MARSGGERRPWRTAAGSGSHGTQRRGGSQGAQRRGAAAMVRSPGRGAQTSPTPGSMSKVKLLEAKRKRLTELKRDAQSGGSSSSNSGASKSTDVRAARRKLNPCVIERRLVAVDARKRGYFRK